MHTRLKSLLGYGALVLAVLLATGCGGADRDSNTSLQGSPTRSAATASSLTSPAARDGDKDVDSLGQGRYDTDNDANPGYGPAASAVERQEVVALIRHYYTAAAAADGLSACALLDPLIAEAVIEEHMDRGPGSLRGNTCSAVAAKVFTQRHRELTKDVAALQVGWVQIQARQAVTLVHFGALRERIVRVRRTHGVWRMDALLDNGPL